MNNKQDKMPNLVLPKLANVNTKINGLKYKRVMLTTARMPDLGTTALHYGDLRPPMGLGYIAALLEQNGIDVVIVDNYVKERDKKV